jgi:drug/metabolite transporter (DMT)-like permease
LIFGALTWAFGSVLSKKWRLQIDGLAAVSWEMTLGGIVNTIFAVMLGQHHQAMWTVRGVSAILYLVVFGSWVGFTAYIYILEHAPIAKVATYSYANPIVAVFLGWLVLHERITGYIIAGSFIVICAVVLVTGAKPQPRKASALSAAESSAD